MLSAKNKWSVLAPDTKKVQTLSEQLNISPIIATLLVNRGIHDFVLARQFLNADEQDFHDPFLLPQMESAIDRIREAVNKHEKIVIFGDYDADGVTSTAILIKALKQYGASDVSYYVPDRFGEGYGLNISAIEMLHEQGTHLIITVDNGISAIAEIEHAKSLGMDVIVTDHHQIGEQLPEAFAIIHPQMDNAYPCAELAGAGVALKVAQALLGGPAPDLVQLAAIGTVADLVPLHDENRFIVAKGLQLLRTSQLLAVEALAQVSRIPMESINEEQIGYVFAPRLNAAGRLGKADLAVDLLLAETKEEAKEIAARLDQLNNERKSIVQRITDEAIRMVEEEFSVDEWPIIVVASVGWSAGVVGIVASKLVDKYGRPAFVIGIDAENNEATGSARSIADYHLYQALIQQELLLTKFGGHAMAAGFSMDAANIAALRMALNQAAQSRTEKLEFIQEKEIDIVTPIERLTIDTIQKIKQLAPFGIGNQQPRLLIEKAKLEFARKIGSNFNHVKGKLSDASGTIELLGFNKSYLMEQVSEQDELKVVGAVNINEWNGKVTPQLVVEDASCEHIQIFDWRSRPLTKVNFDAIPYPRKLIVFRAETLNVLPAAIQSEVALLTSCEEIGLFNDQADHVCLIDYPTSLKDLHILLERISCSKLYLFLKQQPDHLFQAMPSREQFKWVYAFLKQNEPFDTKRHSEMLEKQNKWRKGTVSFIFNVFLELNFAIMEDGLIKTISSVKKDLTESKLYQERVQQVEVEQKLLLSTKDGLIALMRKLMEQRKNGGNIDGY